jgi:mannose/fructose/N-acetylgalactosamine-specific phosphotransferase system component IIB
MLSLIRVDDRLIHGQVMAVWVRALSINHILVIDNITAADAFSQQVMQLAVPTSIKLHIHSIANAALALQNAEASADHVLVLLRDVETAAEIHTLFHLPAINLGGSGMSAGRKLVWRSIALSHRQIELLEKMQTDGVDVYLQMVPSEHKRRYSSEAWRALTHD